MGLIAAIIFAGVTVRVARDLSKTISKKGFARDPHGNIQEFLIGKRSGKR